MRASAACSIWRWAIPPICGLRAKARADAATWWSIPRTTPHRRVREGSVSSNFAFYGGTFDPVHRGHIAVAKAALADSRFKLESIYFVPASVPPHKQGQPITSYADRLAMLQLALSDTKEKRFVASELEAPNRSGVPNYSIDSVRQLKEILGKEHAKPELYF